MRRILPLATAHLLVGICLMVNVPAAGASGPAVETGGVLLSANLWRGITRNDGMVLQPWLDARLGHGAFVRGDVNVDFSTFGGQREAAQISELYLAVGFAPRIGPALLEFGLLELLYPGGPPSTRELYADVRVDVGSGFHLGAAMHGDVGEAQGFYFAFGAGAEWEFGPSLFFEVDSRVAAVTAGWSEYYGGRRGGLHHVAAEGRFGWRPTEPLSIFVEGQGTTNLSSRALPDAMVVRKGAFGAGIAVAFR